MTTPVLPPGRCPDIYKYNERPFRCTLDAGHSGNHGFKRGSWMLLRWSPAAKKEETA